MNGEWSDYGLDKIEVKNPATNETIATVPNGGANEANKATDAAYGAFKVMGWAIRSMKGLS